MLGRLIKVSAVALGAGLVLTACSPVKMGAAAIAGNQRITIATLDTEVTNLSQTVSQYPGILQLSKVQETQETLTWLVRFQINDQLARQAGITVSAAQAQNALQQIYNSTTAEAQAQGVSNVTHSLILAAYGVPPNLANELGRYKAINDEFARQANGGTAPATTAEQSATMAKLQQAQCVAAKSLKIEVNPQYGQMNYAQYQIVPAPGTVFRAEGPAKTASTSGLTPAC